MGRRVGLLVILSRAGSLALAVAAAVVSCLAAQALTADQHTLLLYFVVVLAIFPFGVGGVLLGPQFSWLCLGGRRPTNVKLLLLVAADWVFAWFTFGSGCAALAVGQFVRAPGSAVCVLCLVLAAMACPSGALAAVSAIGRLWVPVPPGPGALVRLLDCA